ncbi:MAG: hypothetical protein Q9216_004432 [Gyalolechia sp. 2 TL-2023]
MGTTLLWLALDRTNLYAESGGQEYDPGQLIVDRVPEINMKAVQSYGGYVPASLRLHQRSLVALMRLRFDFLYRAGVTDDEIKQVERHLRETEALRDYALDGHPPPHKTYMPKISGFEFPRLD